MSLLAFIGHGLVGLVAAYYVVRMSHDLLGIRGEGLVLLFFVSVPLWPLTLLGIAVFAWSKNAKEEATNGRS